MAFGEPEQPIVTLLFWSLQYRRRTIFPPDPHDLEQSDTDDQGPDLVCFREPENEHRCTACLIESSGHFCPFGILHFRFLN